MPKPKKTHAPVPVSRRESGARDDIPEVAQGEQRPVRDKPPTTDEAIALASRHGPASWQKELPTKRLVEALDKGVQLRMIVLSADIRSSTFLMKEAVDFRRHAAIINGFINAVSTSLRQDRGWFDKFTGDGFLGYWIVDERRLSTYVGELLGTCRDLLGLFNRVVLDDIRKNSRNLPERVGLSLGIDGGRANLVKVAGELTIVGHPVVGAVRMVSAAKKPGQTLMNVYMGELLYRTRSALADRGVVIDRCWVRTKEYCQGQEAYSLTFDEGSMDAASRYGVVEVPGA